MYNCTNITDSGLTHEEYIFDTIGLIGGIIFPICQIPQIIRVIKTKSSTDLEMSSLVLFVFATIFIIIYSMYFNLYPVYIPSYFDFVVQIILISLKIHYDKLKKKKHKKYIETKKIDNIIIDISNNVN